ncbi:Uncharacterised protein [[Clostridium] sordellii]|uniref:hypothetical protein n=1 Tax=Paraclostridium sordellii TaxID=1505 RepID=UPI0005E5E034|nr:hypothetical protein [Paeniclostridium sordellii]CEQ10651.1 Uncharacterised protein [[Clostridium] sordellii] [Paeniclostridium sordellii]
MKKGIIYFLENKLISVVCIASLLYFTYNKLNILEIENYNVFISNIITVTSIFIGILMSMLGFLLTISGKDIVKRIKEFKVHKKIINYFILPTISGVLIVIISILISLFKINKININVLICISIILGVLIVYFTLSFIRIITLMYFILINVFEEDEKSEILNTKKNESSEINLNNINEVFDNPEEFY